MALRLTALSGLLAGTLLVTVPTPALAAVGVDLAWNHCLGQLAVYIVGQSNGTEVPQDLAPACDCVKVTVAGQPFANIKAATFDRDGITPGAGAGDFGLIRFDFVNCPTACRSDLDFSGGVGATDLGLLRLYFVLGNSLQSGIGCITGT